MPLQERDISWLVRKLNLQGADIMGPLTTSQELEWAFYRVSARHPTEVWQSASRAWQSKLTLQEASGIVSITPSRLVALIAGQTQRQALTRPPAAILAERLELNEGPELFLKEALALAREARTPSR